MELKENEKMSDVLTGIQYSSVDQANLKLSSRPPLPLPTVQYGFSIRIRGHISSISNSKVAKIEMR
jgi:hypothetical protein